MVDIGAIFQFGVLVLLYLIAVGVGLRWGGPYPTQLPQSSDERRELIEIAVLYVVGFSAVLYSIAVVLDLISFRLTLFRLDDVTFGMGFLLMTVTRIILPAITELGIRDRSLADLGIRWPLNWRPALLLIGIGAIFGLLPLLLMIPSPPSVAMIVVGLYSPVIVEEFLFRGVLQTKFERITSQQRAWIYSGLLFGLSHAPNELYVAFAGGGDPLVALVRLLGQTVAGFFFGLLFLKSRSLLAPIIAHYLSNDLAWIVATILE